MKKIMIFAAVACALSAEAKNEESYLFTYFTGNAPEQEQIHYALSSDGWNYTPLNDGAPVILSDTIALKKCVRDPHILRGHDGWFYQVITDMRCWDGWSSNRGLILMRSRDLIKWEHHAINFPDRYKGTDFAKVTRVWAPQTIWDEKAGKYMVYYSLRTGDEQPIPYDRVYWNYANADFSDLEGEPQVLFDVHDAAIDTDIIRDDNGDYHVFFKTEGAKQKGIKQFITKDLHSLLSQQPREGFCQDTNEAVEGSGVFRLHDGTWVLMYDCYGAHHYQFCKSDDLLTFKAVKNTKTHGKFTPRHGTVIAITPEERDRLETWSRLMVATRDLKQRSVPTLTLDQLKGRKAMLQDLQSVLDGPVDIKAYKAAEARLKAFYSK